MEKKKRERDRENRKQLKTQRQHAAPPQIDLIDQQKVKASLQVKQRSKVKAD